MTRWLYGQTPADFTVDPSGRARPGVPLTVWTEASGGELVTDLLTWDGLPIQTATSDSSGLVRFYGPDSFTGPLWLDPGVGARLLIRPAQVVAAAGGGGPHPFLTMGA